MAQKKKKPKSRQIGKTRVPQKKPLIDPKYKNTVWTIIIIVILAIFFIINNTKPVPDQGPYPPGYNPKQADSILHQNH
jgi:uncharacterized integral membrane protein